MTTPNNETITPEIVRKIARLARINVPQEQESKLQQELNGLLKWVEQLQEVNTDNVEPLASVALQNETPFREDMVSDGAMAEQILANAPKQEQKFFVVPKVIE